MSEVVKAAPPLGVAGMKVFGVLLSDWVIILTIIYTLFLIIDKAETVFSKVAGWAQKLRNYYGNKEGK